MILLQRVLNDRLASIINTGVLEAHGIGNARRGLVTVSGRAKRQGGACLITTLKNIVKIKKSKVFAALGVCILSAANIQADQISGAITISGGADLDSNNLNIATRVDAWIEPSVRSVSGDFDTFVNPLDSVAMTAPWVFNSGLPALWSVGGFTFDLLTSAIVFQDSGFLVVQGNGLAHGNGFEPTEGRFTFTTQEPDALGIFSFSASVSNEPDGRLGDFVWDDTDADGIQDVGESGINGVIVNLLDCSDVPLASTITANHPVSGEPGYYLFDELQAGCYRVEFELPAGYAFSPNDQGADDSVDSDADLITGRTGDITLDVGETDLTWDAGVHRPARLGDFVWHDLNANGIQDAGEPGIPDVTVNLLDSSASVIGSTATDASGIYGFSDLTPGTYSVQFVAPAGFFPSPQNQGADDAVDSDADLVTGETAQVALAAGEANLTLDAGFYQKAAIGDFVWLDLDSDGVQDAGESGVPGVVVQLIDCASDAIIGTMPTDGSGLYLFTGLTPGDYRVRFNLPAGTTFSPQDQGADDAVDSDADTTTGETICTSLVSGETDLTWDAGIIEPTECPPSTFVFHGSTPTDGYNGNIRTYTVNGVSVNVSAFSRTSAGSWASAYLGVYNGGFGVTDSGEGDGSGNRHTVDNIDRNNFVLFEFSQPVIVNRAFLGYVVGDSDLKVWIGNSADPFNNHITLNDAALAGLGYTEDNDTALTGVRWADFNGGALSGNILVISASVTDATPDDQFKIQKLDICPPPVVEASIGDFVWNDTDADGTQDAGESGVDGVKVELLRCSDNAVVGTTTTSAGGIYGFTVLPGDYYVRFSNLPAGFVFSPSSSSGASDPNDSDANPTTGVTDCTTLVAGENDLTWDAGINKPQPPPEEPCVPTTIVFNGSSAGDGANGNIRTFSAGGVSVKVSAFSRTSGGSWASAYLGIFSGGLGVTDSGEGDGSNNRHTVDNLDRQNYVLFEFSAPVVVNRAFLGYVVGDSDLSVWVGNFGDPYNNHLTLSDAVLAGFGYTENNDTTSSSARWADFNAGEIVGNTLVIAASVSDATPDDRFKIEKLDICAPPAEEPCPSPWGTKDIGYVKVSGSVSYNSETKRFTVKGSGADIWGSSDEFRYGYVQASGNCIIAARVVSQGNTDPWAKAGVMIRESLNANSQHASAFITPGNGAAFQYRTSTGGSSGNVNQNWVNAPHWVAVVRDGNTFTAYQSENGVDWTPIGSKSISMNWSVYIGLAVTSHNDGALSSAVFEGVFASP